MWANKNARPEERGGFDEEFPRYNLQKTQEKIALRAIELSSPDLSSKALDAGCGNGYSMQVMKKLFQKVKGFDASKKMVSEAKKKKLDVKVGVFQEIPFKEKFGFVLSVSALQWVPLAEMSLVAREFWRVLKSKGKAAVQLYVKSEQELFEYAKSFRAKGFAVKIIQDNYENARKRKTYILLGKP